MPREGHDNNTAPCYRGCILFQSTCPARGTTAFRQSGHSFFTHFNPRAPRGARPATEKQIGGAKYFNPRAPRGARRHGFFNTQHRRSISIHVPREGHDKTSSSANVAILHFNPRAPRGARLRPFGEIVSPNDFNPRAPRGARLIVFNIQSSGVAFQSTCPARGTTCILLAKLTLRRYFNPRAPRGARLRKQTALFC